MAKELLGVHKIPPIAPNFGLLPGMLALNVKVMGGFIREGIREHTPKRSWLMHGKCKIISMRMTKFTGRVRVGWQKRDFPRGKFYAVWVGEGTGIYGDRHQRIVGKRAKGGRQPMIRYPYAGKWVSMKSTKGIKPRKMLEKGYASSIDDIMRLMTKTTFSFFAVTKRA